MSWQTNMLTQRLPLPSQSISEPKQQAMQKAAANLSKLFQKQEKEEKK